MINKAWILIVFLSVCSCNNNKSTEKPVIAEPNLETETIDVKALFDELNKNMPQEIKSIDYYKNMILEDESSQRYLELNDIMQIENLIPGFICFIVRWTDFEGYVYKLYSFDNEHLINAIYNCGNGWPFPYTKILTQNIPGNKIGDFLFVFDINNDGINEIVTFTFNNLSFITICGFDVVEYRFKNYLETEFYFNYDERITPIKVELVNNTIEITILAIADKEMFDFEWVKYIYDKEKRVYKRKNIA